MLQKTIEIKNKLGLHARAAMKLTKLADRFQSDILIRYKGREVNAKDILSVMVLAVSYGTLVDLIVSGEDEENAMRAVESLIENKFDEE